MKTVYIFPLTAIFVSSLVNAQDPAQFVSVKVQTAYNTRCTTSSASTSVSPVPTRPAFTSTLPDVTIGQTNTFTPSSNVFTTLTPTSTITSTVQGPPISTIYVQSPQRRSIEVEHVQGEHFTYEDVQVPSNSSIEDFSNNLRFRRAVYPASVQCTIRQQVVSTSLFTQTAASRTVTRYTTVTTTTTSTSTPTATVSLPSSLSFNGGSCSLNFPSTSYTCSYTSSDRHQGLVSNFVPPCSGSMSVRIGGGHGANNYNNGASQPGRLVTSNVNLGSNRIPIGTNFDVILGGDGYSPYYEGRNDGGFNGGGKGDAAGAGGGGFSAIKNNGNLLVVAGGGGGNGDNRGQPGVGFDSGNYVSGTNGQNAAQYSRGGGGGGGLQGGAAGSGANGGNIGLSKADQIVGYVDGSAFAQITFTCQP